MTEIITVEIILTVLLCILCFSLGHLVGVVRTGASSLARFQEFAKKTKEDLDQLVSLQKLERDLQKTSKLLR